ncbi:DUF1573 domain-containing protein [bacterium]|nr:MAG: DUF1573 domain-containing protein [bacterium]
MIRILLFIILTTAVAVGPAQGQNKPEAARGLAEFYLWDFGRVKQGDVVRHNFNLKNTTGKTFKIKDVTTSCGCMASAAKKDKLLPGESTEIGVEFDSQGYSGPVQQFIYVHTDAINTSTPLGSRPESLDLARDGFRERNSRTFDNSVIRFIIKADVVK